MGTRGYLVFCWKGRRVIIYNHYDSYPSCMGAQLFRQLATLLQRFQGDIKKACKHWGNLVAALQLTYSDNGDLHPFNQIHAFDNVEQAFLSTLPLCVCEDHELDVWIEFVWTIDLDESMFRMKAHGGYAEWSFTEVHRGFAFNDMWVLEAEIAACSDADLTENTEKPFNKAVTSAAAVQIQASARRFLEVSRGLRPGGILVKLAARRFHHASAALMHSTTV